MCPTDEVSKPDDEDTVAVDLDAQIAADLNTGHIDLPGFPEAVLRIQRKIDSPDSSADDVVKVLSAEPALAARALQIANSVAFQGNQEITDLRTAVSRLGFNLVRSIAIAFAIQQLRLRGSYSEAARAEIEAIWHSSVKVASASYVLAEHYSEVNPDQALLAGLLHVLGRLYIVMRMEDMGGSSDAQTIRSSAFRQGHIGKVILQTWNLPEALQNAVEHQDDVEYEAGDITATDILIAAKFLTENREIRTGECRPLDRLATAGGADSSELLQLHADELRALRQSLGD